MLYTTTSVPIEGLHFDFWSQIDDLSHTNLSMNDLIFSEIMNLWLVVFYLSFVKATILFAQAK